MTALWRVSRKGPELLKKQYKEIQQNLGLAITMLEKGQLTEGMKENILSLTDHNVNRFLTRMGYEGVLAEKQKKLTEQIRSLNDENRKLRHQLGEKVSNEDVRERLRIMVSSVTVFTNSCYSMLCKQ